MSSTTILRSAAELREQFDQGFALPPEGTGEASIALLALRVRTDPFALRVSELAGLFVRRRVVPLPNSQGGLLGLMCLRGQLVPVYDMGVMLGYAPAKSAPGWLLQVQSAESFVLAFDAFDGQFVVPETALLPVNAAHLPALCPQGHLEAVAPCDSPRPVIDLSAVLATLMSAQAASRPVSIATRSLSS